MTAIPESDIFTTYRRADGALILGEYTFQCTDDGFDDEDEPTEYIKETWQLVTREMLWYGPPRMKPCWACEGLVAPADDCVICDGSGEMEMTP